MTDIQLPLNQNHQHKGVINGRLLPKTNYLEIRGDPVSIIGSSHRSVSNNSALHNPNQLILMNNELSAQNYNKTTSASIMSSNISSSTKRAGIQPAQTAGTLVNVNLNFEFNPGAGPLPRKQRRGKLRQQQQQQFLTLSSNQNRVPVGMSKKGTAPELTLSSSRLIIAEENHQFVNKSRVASDGFEQVWWPSLANNNQIMHGINTNNNQIVIDNCCNSMSTSAAWTASTTGVMSDRSSVYSIDDGGDFDREASHKVNKQLKEIEAILYEQVVLHPNQFNHHFNKLNEYEEWSLKFPHLRILGSSVLKEDSETTSRSSMPNNLNNSYKPGTSSHSNESDNNLLNKASKKITNQEAAAITNDSESFPVEVSKNPNSNTQNLTNKYSRRRENTDLNNQGLYLNGQQMPIRKLEKVSEEYVFLEEETFEKEGTYEELLAYDNQEEEHSIENKRLNLTKRRRHGLPPISPKASLRDLVKNFLFDFMWSSLVDWSTILIKEYAKHVADGQMNLEPLTRTNTEVSSVSENYQDPSGNIPRTATYSQGKSADQQSLQGVINLNNAPSNGSSKNQLANSIVAQSLKTTSVHVKPFDPTINNSTNGNSNEKAVTTQQQIYTPVNISRDNSTLANNQLNRYNTILGTNEHTNDGKPVDDADLKMYLQIKQLTSKNSNLAPISSSGVSLSRVGSGKLQQQSSQQARTHHLNKKRYSSIEMSSGIAGGQNGSNVSAQQTSVSALGVVASNSPTTSSSNSNSVSSSIHISGLGYQKLTNSSSNDSSLPSSLNTHHIVSGQASYHNNRSSNNSTLLHHHETAVDEAFNVNPEILPAGDGVGSSNEITNIEEINLAGGNIGKQQNQAHVHFYSPHQQPFSVHHLHQLPPISNSLKPLRISSANNLNNNKEKIERPLTSTAIRMESLNYPFHKRSTTPSGLVSTNKIQNYYHTNKKRFNASLEDPINNINNSLSIVNSLGNFLSTKSLASMNHLVNQNNATSLNRRNSIKESQVFQRLPK